MDVLRGKSLINDPFDRWYVLPSPGKWVVYDIVLTTLWYMQWCLTAFNRDVMGIYGDLITSPLLFFLWGFGKQKIMVLIV